MLALMNDRTIGRSEPQLPSVVEMLRFNSYTNSAINVSRQPGIRGPGRSPKK